MAIVKQSIPGMSYLPSELQHVLIPMKQNIEIMTGAMVGVGPIAQLAATASTADVINKINEIIVRLNQAGQ